MIGSNLRVNGGITRVIKNYIKAGLDKKVDLKFYPTYFGSGNHIIDGVYFVVQYMKLYINYKIFRNKVDIIHVHMSYKGSFYRKKYIINLFFKLGVPIVLHMHGSKFKKFYNNSSVRKKNEISYTLNKVSMLLALGEEWKEFYSSITSAKVISFNNAVFSKKITTFDNKIYITTMGILSKRKGTYDIIKIAKKLDTKINKQYKFLLVGDGDLKQINKLILKENLDNRILTTGWIQNDKQIEEIYNKTIIYLLPSYNEGMPMSILEAMSYGIPIISTNVGSISSLVKKKNGYVCKPGDIDEMVNKIIDLLNDKEKYKMMSIENKNTIKNHYCIDDSIEDLISLYSQLL